MRKNGLKLIIGAALTAVLLFGCGLNNVNENNDNANNDRNNATVEMNNQEESTVENGMNSEKIQENGNMNSDITEMEEVEEVKTMIPNEGEMAPDFEFVDSSGTIYNNETLHGEKVYLKYWASWCSICLAGLDEIDTLFTEAEGFSVYTVVTPGHRGELSQEDFEEWIGGLEQKNIKVLFDMNGEAATEFGVRAFPTSIFIGSDGILISTLPGHQSNEDIIEKIDSFY